MKRIEENQQEKPEKKVKKVTKKPVTKKATAKKVADETKKKPVRKTVKKIVKKEEPSILDKPIEEILNEPIIEIEDMVKPIKKSFKHIWKEAKKVLDKNSALRFMNIKYQKKEKRVCTFNQAQMMIAVLFTIIVAATSGIFVGKTIYEGKGNQANETKTYGAYIDTFASAYRAIVENYYGTVDQKAMIDAAITAMAGVTGDPNTSYLNQEETSSFNDRISGKYTGIGIAMYRINQDVTITDVFPGSPAETGGLKTGDIILAVDDKDATTMSTADLSTYIRGTNYPSYTIKVKRNNQELSYTLSKAQIDIPSVEKELFERNGKKIGYLSINIFAANSAQQFKTKLGELEAAGMDSLIIDVRNNTGGYLNIATDIIQTFLKEGQAMLQIQNSDGITPRNDTTPEYKTYPVAVIINGNSASASEILAAAMKETYGSQIIGEKSFGKGTVQRPFDLDNGGIIKVTIEKWLSPTGKSIEVDKVVPTKEVVLDSAKYYANPTNENDNQLQEAINTLAK